MSSLPDPIQNAIEALSDLPGIGKRSAERLIFTLLKNQTGLDQKIAQNIGQLKSSITECENCCHFCEQQDEKTQNLCPVCVNVNRDQRVLCIVESPLDLIAIERTHEYKGQYHVLHGVISPLHRIRPEDLRLEALFERCQKNKDIEEVIIALAGSTEAEATALYIVEHLNPHFTGKVSRLARGIPSGGDLDYLDTNTIGRALSERRIF
jgi:recombination protein RecR